MEKLKHSPSIKITIEQWGQLCDLLLTAPDNPVDIVIAKARVIVTRAKKDRRKLQAAEEMGNILKAVQLFYLRNLPWTLHITQTGGVVLDRDKAAVCFVDRMMVKTVRETIRRINEMGENDPIE